MSVKKVAAKSGSKKTRPSPTHPSWVDMIKECIAAYPEDARSGVSRPQIKKFVEEKYKIVFDPTQLSHLSKAIGSGAEKGTFVLPKGPSGRIKLPPKVARVADTSASKENKPAKAVPKPATKARPAKTATTKATTAKSATTKKTATKAKAVTTARSTTKKPATQTAARSSATKPAAAKAKSAPAPKKTLAGKKSVPAKKATPSSKRGTAKKAVTGSSPARGKVVSAKKPAAKKPAPRSSASTTGRKKTTKK